MKKILNDPFSYVDEMLEGFVTAHPDQLLRRGPEGRVIARAGGPRQGKVGVVSGGGSGHLPLFTGYVGHGLLDACAIGDVFSSPSVDQIVEAITAAHAGAGVLLIYGNYSGDTMNFSMASDIVGFDGIRTETVRGADDVASATPVERDKRRGVAGLVYGYKIAGALAEAMADLDEVSSVTRRAMDSCRSIGVALTPCVLPAAGKPTFQLGDDEMELGMGIHGEPGVVRGPLENADSIADSMLDRLLDDMPLHSGDTVSILLNSLGATPLEELYILYRRIAVRLADLRVTIKHPMVGRYATSMEMAGASLSILLLDGQLEELLAAPCTCPFWRV